MPTPRRTHHTHAHHLQHPIYASVWASKAGAACHLHIVKSQYLSDLFCALACMVLPTLPPLPPPTVGTECLVDSQGCAALLLCRCAVYNNLYVDECMWHAQYSATVRDQSCSCESMKLQSKSTSHAVCPYRPSFFMLRRCCALSCIDSLCHYVHWARIRGLVSADATQLFSLQVYTLQPPWQVAILQVTIWTVGVDSGRARQTLPCWSSCWSHHTSRLLAFRDGG